ncbi:ExeM/NucH family extracellular endonuclease [Microbacterium sp. zg.Y625]|uniref:ExeM/NucH family extracellular endonuclease n=1 Tax=Microbacterium jiangjiandongii TaxID=3049071 RepID=UPI00214C7468|nr:MULTISPECIES: ExeM/NucH family extracellular endonuclease [unclassified Microbacterium]MCR2792838.1 ExeM/NucH family extracellular endonuclease [Microbacterium sp. zg.Y625]WIM26810.1 ExeM/NucH family extracellular endonuclease [Microbacterium sp. zg-Y625]
MTQRPLPLPARPARRRPWAILTVAATVAAGVALTPAAHAAVSADAPVVIAEVYGGGGNSGGAYQRDFIELANVSDADVDLSAYSVQYASATGGNWQVTPLTGQVVPAGGRLLVGQATGADITQPGFEADVDGAIALSGSQGKVALVSSLTPLSGATALVDLPQVVDFVGWGGATHFAGSAAAPGTTNAQSVSRDDAAANTADNAADFSVGTPTPQGLGTGGTGPEPEPEPEPTVVAIADIQGAQAESPLVGRTVTTTGVVTAHYPTGGFAGYVIQTPGTGGALDPAAHVASDAVFVRASEAVSEVALGDTVQVTGVVGEYQGLTQLTVSTGGAAVIEPAAAPVPATVGWPADDAQREALESMLVAPQGPFTVTNTYSTNQYGEVGLAAGDTPLRQPTDVARPGSAEAAAVAADNAARAVTLDDGTSVNFQSAANSALTPAYVSLAEPIVVGGAVAFAEPVIVDYRNGAWKLNPTAPLTGDGSGVDGVSFTSPRTAAPDEVGGDLSIASFNVLNYFTTVGTDSASCVAYTDRFGDGVTVREGCDQRGAWDAEDLQRQQDKIVAAIEQLDADVVGLMEIENSAALGEEADEATATLVDALNAASEQEKWAYVASSDDLPDLSQQDVITNAIIYQPAAVSPVGAAMALGDQSGPDQAFGNAREPIAQVFEPTDGGEPFLFVVNHFKSKGSPGPWPGDADTGDGQGAANESRVRQATALRDWVADVQGEADVDAVALVGDFNSYGQEDPLQVLYEAGFTGAEAAFNVTTRSYSFSGLSGSLDHVLLNEAALGRATGADIWNINSGEALALEYSRFRSHGTEFYAPDVYRSSDHDPIKVGLTADAAPVSLTLLGINDFHGRIDANTVKFAGTIEQLRESAAGDVLFLSAGDNIGASLFASSVAQDQPTIDVLNALGLASSAVGNHEFDRGWEDLSGRVTDAFDAPQLGANVYLAGTETPALPEYSLHEVEGLTVGVIGAVTEETATLVSPAGITALEFGDPVEAVNRVAGELSDGDAANGEADVLVALYHEGAGAGTPDGATLEEELAAGGAFAALVNDTAAEVDAIFTGHTHKEYAWSAAIPGTDRTRPVVQTGSYGARVGEITLTLDADSGEVTAHTERNVERTTTDDAALIAQYPRVAEVSQIAQAALAAAAEVGNTSVGEVAADITTAHAGGSFVDGVWTGGDRDDRTSESTLGNTVANMLRDSLADLPDGAVIGVTNPGGLRADLWDTQAEFGATAVPGLPDGTVSFSQANAVLPFNNTLGLVTLTGEQFTTMLEQQWQRDADGNVPQRQYLQLGLSDNVAYTFDPALPEGERITSVTVDGQPIDPAAEYRIGTFSFLASGGDNFRVFTEGTGYVDTGLLDYEAWVDYIADNSPLAPSYAERAVQVSGVPETVEAGAEVQFSVAGLNLTSRGAPENTTLSVALGDTVLGEVPVTATVSVTLPAGVAAGAAALTLTAQPSGTVVTVPIEVAATAVEKAQTTTRMVPLLPVHINRLLPTTLVAYVQQSGARPDGTVEFREGGADGALIGTAPVRSGLASLRLGTLTRGIHSYTAVFVPRDAETVAGSQSTPVKVRVIG